jgi:nitrogen fixation NifU-like protein
VFQPIRVVHVCFGKLSVRNVYSEALMDHFHRPRNVGPLAGATHQGTAGQPGNGPYVVIWLEVRDGQIERAAYQTFGCPSAIGSASAAAEWVTGKRIEEALGLTEADVTAALGGVPEGKEHCPALAVRALQAALQGGR